MTLITASHTHAGGRDQTAVIGHAPESRDWRPGDPAWQPIIAPSARLEAFVTVDAGTMRPTRIGERAWLMKRVHVGHDAVIEDGAELAPGVIVGGWAIVGHGARVGMGAVIRNRVTVGAGARVGCGAVVVRDVPPGVTVVGNPARRLEGT